MRRIIRRIRDELGERHRAKTERNNEDRKIETFRFCGACCATFAILEGPDGDDEPMMVRYAQGRPVDLLNIEIDDGKYTLIQRADGSGEILRYGEPWMAPLCNVAGSKMILAMGYELERLRVSQVRRRPELRPGGLNDVD